MARIAKSIEDVKKDLEGVNCKLIEAYTGKDRKRRIKYICKNGHEADSDLYSVVNGTGTCKDCRKLMTGENHHNWKGGHDSEEIRFRRTAEYKKWRIDVMKKHYFTCQCCNEKSNDLPNNNKLVVHHLDGYSWSVEKRIDIDNGVTLCKKCHDLFHKLYGKINNTKEQFDNFLVNLNKNQESSSNEF